MDSATIARVQEKLDGLVEEETGRKLGELNLVTEVSVAPDGAVFVRFRPLSPYSPTAVSTGRKIRAAVLEAGATAVNVECSGHMLDELVNRLVNGEKEKR